MSNITVFPGKLKGTVKIPASKSIAHRAVICAALGAGASQLLDLTISEDVQATIDGVKALGAAVAHEGDQFQIIGMRKSDDRLKWAEKFGGQTWRLTSQGGRQDQGGKQGPGPEGIMPVIDCGESGSTLRFLLPLALVRMGQARFLGRGRLGQRPMEPYYQIFDQQGISYKQSQPGKNSAAIQQAAGLDLQLAGNLQPGEFVLPGNVSSQFISGLLFALPLLKADSSIRLTTPLESKGYLDMTIKVMHDFGVDVSNEGNHTFRVEGRQRYQSTTYSIEGDYSQAAFFLAADALGSEVEVAGLKAKTLQGDREILNLIMRMGGHIHQGEKGVLAMAGSEGLQAAEIDASQCPDLVPILAVLAALSQGTTEIIKAERLRLKECDRLQAVAVELCKLGARVQERPDGLVIEGVPALRGGVQVSSHQDHRIAMSLAMAATCCELPVEITDSQCVQKSYTDFWRDFQSLGGKIEIGRQVL